MKFTDGFNLLSIGMDKVSSANAELLALREEKEVWKKTDGIVKPLLRCGRDKIEAKAAIVGSLLEREGCLSIPNILSDSTCNDLLAFINNENELCKNDVTNGMKKFDDVFGGVNCRGLNGIFGVRQDMFLPSSSNIVTSALSEATNNLKPLLLETVTDNGMIHEISCFVADPGSPRQCVHADTIVLPCPQFPNAEMDPIYTIFMALQDVEDDMGHTQFFPRTHTPNVHTLWNSKAVQNDTPRFVGVNQGTQSALKKGDVSIFDSRLLHCGMANKSNKRRVLFYFSVSKSQRWPLDGGLHGPNSIRAEDRYRWQVKDFLR